MDSPSERIYNDIKKHVKSLLQIIGGILIVCLLVFIVLGTTSG